VKLHLGCGRRYLPGFYHIDALAYSHVDMVADIAELKLPDESADEIYLCHVLEHFPRQSILPLLRNFYRILKQEGCLRISVPDFKACVEHYNGHNLHELLGLLVGGQRKDQYDFHSMIFDFELLKLFLENSGFQDISIYSAEEFLPKDFDDYSKAYLPHRDPTGRLMSLNVRATKRKEMEESFPSNPVLAHAVGIKRQYEPIPIISLDDL
jgi:predicted SAM-dependent methyltransferase